MSLVLPLKKVLLVVPCAAGLWEVLLRPPGLRPLRLPRPDPPRPAALLPRPARPATVPASLPVVDGAGVVAGADGSVVVMVSGLLS